MKTVRVVLTLEVNEKDWKMPEETDRVFRQSVREFAREAVAHSIDDRVYHINAVRIVEE